MRLPSLYLALAGLATLCRAESGPDDDLLGRATTTTTQMIVSAASTSAVPTQTVAVGATGFTYTPDSISVAVGTVVEFDFYPGNHSVVRSAFGFPCIPYEDTGPNRVGFFSGFRDTNVYSSDGPKFRVRINDTEPIFYYCAAPGSCITYGMIGVINPNATFTLATQKIYVANTTFQVAPGEPLPSEVAPTTTTALATPTGSRPSSSLSPSSSQHGLSSGGVAGVVLGTLALVLLLILIVFFACCVRPNTCWERYRYARERRRRMGGPSRRYGGGGRGGDGAADSSNAYDGGSTTDGSPLAPLSPATCQSTPGSGIYQKYGSPGPGSVSGSVVGSRLGPMAMPQSGLGGLPPDMADMGEYFSRPGYRHRTPPLPPLPSVSRMPSMPSMPSMPPDAVHPIMAYAQQPQYLQHLLNLPNHGYVSGLPIYNSMATMTTMPVPVRSVSPLQSNPAPHAASASPFDDHHYASSTAPLPVELPTAVTTSAPVAMPAVTATATTTATTLAAAQRRMSPPALKESPTIGAIQETWGGDTADTTELTQI